MRHPPERVVLRNVRQHNLKGITVEFPRRALSVITGPSGSGKSSLAFDTLYAEGQRRYIESLSTYAKQFLERMPKPLVDAMEGLSPAVAIEQKNPTTSSRSTVGTATEIADFLRLLWARAGTQVCLQCGRDVKRDTVQEVVDSVIADFGMRNAELPVLVSFPLPASAQRPDVEIAAQLRAAGFVRAQVDGELVRLDDEGAEQRVRAGKDVLVIVDRIDAIETNRGRLADAVSTAFSEGEGVALALNNGDRRRFSEHPACSACGCAAPVLTPTLFSFNNPRGACPGCNGFGAVLEYDEALIVPDPRASLANGALDPWTKPRYEGRRRLLRETARARRIGLDVGWKDIPARERHFLLHNTGGRYLGIFPFLKRLEEKRYKQYIRVFLRQYQLAKTCPGCGGARLKPESLAVRVAGKTIAEAAALTATDLACWLDRLTDQLPEFQRRLPATSWASCGRASASSTTSASAISPSTGRRGRCRAAKHSASRSPMRSARISWTRCTCWTSRPSACIPRTSIGCWDCCANWRLPETRWSWWSTIPPRCAPRTGWWSWGRRAAQPAASSSTRGRRPRCARPERSPASTSRAKNASACRPRAGRRCAGSTSKARGSTTSPASMCAFRSARSPR